MADSTQTLTLPATLVARRVVRLSLAGARLPVSLVENFTERAGFDVTRLPLVAVFDAVEAQAKMVLGRLLGDDGLVREGIGQEQSLRQRNRTESTSRIRAEEEQAAAEVRAKSHQREAAVRRAAQARDRAEVARGKAVKARKQAVEATGSGPTGGGSPTA